MSIIMTYIVTSYSFTYGCQRYFDTLSKLGNSVTPIVVEYQKDNAPDVNYPSNAQVYRVNKPYPGNTGRFIALYDLFEQTTVEYKPEDWIIFTDTHDVIFQNIPDLSKVKENIIVTPEYKTFEQVEFWNPRVPKGMYDWEVYNVGLFAMRLPLFKQFLRVIRGEWDKIVEYRNRPGLNFPYDVTIAKESMTQIFNSYADTIYFNQFIRYLKVFSQNSLFGCLSFGIEKKKIKLKNGIYLNEFDVPISIVHANGGK